MFLNKIKFFLNKLNEKSIIRKNNCYYKKYFLTEDEQIQRIKSHLSIRRKNHEISENIPSKPHVFIAVKNVNWEKAGLVDSWSDIANVTHFDWADNYDQYDTGWHENGKYKFNEELFSRVKKEHSRSKIDIFFSYLSGRWVIPETIEKINKLGIITINFGFDDTISFWGVKERTGYSGNAEIAKCFDICVTSQNSKDIGQYIKVGANPVFIPSGGNEKVFGLKENPAKKYDVSFIGQNYGERTKIINYLRKKGINVLTRGKGWAEGSISQDEMLEIYAESLVTLGFGYIGSTKEVGLKGRDFEVAMTGCCYITTYNEELGKFLTEDKEILFYKNKKELLNKIKFYLEYPALAGEIGRAGKKKAISRHKWSDRWKKLLKICE
jgi:spore maturation protein CgeB